ncbi:hypothetical protein BGW80DRAFT_1247900 [Lactifluus volemus]|nr:hypothetical protein BGW80DRAFT_1247900 [Lactifluus volemus]
MDDFPLYGFPDGDLFLVPPGTFEPREPVETYQLAGPALPSQHPDIRDDQVYTARPLDVEPCPTVPLSVGRGIREDNNGPPTFPTQISGSNHGPMTPPAQQEYPVALSNDIVLETGQDSKYRCPECGKKFGSKSTGVINRHRDDGRENSSTISLYTTRQSPITNNVFWSLEFGKMRRQAPKTVYGPASSRNIENAAVRGSGGAMSALGVPAQMHPRPGGRRGVAARKNCYEKAVAIHNMDDAARVKASVVVCLQGQTLQQWGRGIHPCFGVCRMDWIESRARIVVLRSRTLRE